MPTSPDPALPTQISTTLLQKYHLPISQPYLTTLLASTRQQPPPFPALLSTAHFRLLNSDFSTSLSTSNPTSLFPLDVGDVNVKERRLQANIPVQVLDIIDIGVSKWAQVEAIERVERGEEVRGREVIRTVAGVTDDDDLGGQRGVNAGGAPAVASTKRSQGPHKLVLQDANKMIVTAFELGDVPKVFIGEEGMGIGCKLVLKSGTLVRRGMVMLQPESVIVLGGKIDSWDKKWREERKKRLIADVEREQEQRRNER